jgi:hypothetical protein
MYEVCGVHLIWSACHSSVTRTLDTRNQPKQINICFCFVHLFPGQLSDVFCLSQCEKLSCLLSVTCYVVIVLSLVLVCSSDNKNNIRTSCVISHVCCQSYRRQLVKFRMLSNKQSCPEAEFRVFFDIWRSPATQTLLWRQCTLQSGSNYVSFS